MDEVRVKEYLSKTDENFRRLVEKAYLSPEEQFRETELKKRKLVLKDQMHFLISQYRAQEGAS